MARSPQPRRSGVISSNALDGTNFCLRTEFEKEQQSAALSLFLNALREAPDKKRVNFCFLFTADLGVNSEQSIVEAYNNVPMKIAHCRSEDATHTNSSSAGRLNMEVSRAFDLVIKNQVVFMHGEEQFRDGLTYRLADRIYSGSLNTLLKPSANGDRTLIFPFKSFEDPGINSIFGMLQNFILSNPQYSDLIAFSFFTLKPEHVDFSDLNTRVLKVFAPHAHSVSKAVFDCVWNESREKLTLELKVAMDKIDGKRIETIQSFLVKGLLHGGNRASDRPWGIDQVTNECRKRILSAVVREAIPVYSSADRSLPEPDVFFKESIQPYFDYLDLPYSCVNEAAPALRSAKRRLAKS